MAEILYTYKHQVYANITNKCNCRCTFCIRGQEEGIGDAQTLWHKKDPSLDEILAAMDAFDLMDTRSWSTVLWRTHLRPGESAGICSVCQGDLWAVHTCKYKWAGKPLSQERYHPSPCRCRRCCLYQLNAPDADKYNAVSLRSGRMLSGASGFASACRGNIPSVKLSI